ncbi:SEFIR domain-containing protein [Chitinophaga eiseniae]|uniref:SEFIR domain-containing protein n=1 Tax=Chitinophaga eiseniae TaxID=634771 RepID=A0A1T4SYJ2_9BACT|nr:SEFIR domain-containing protein [Chitinophaga eiseniae]SKA32988.1 SEFIR domain-containing protein [Chitinophaga eiseniae]
MNDFYDISDSQEIPDVSLQLENLGEQRIFMTLGKSSRDGWGEREHTSQHYYTKTTAEDYDNLFASRISRTKPPYAVEHFLDHHFQCYLKRFPGAEKTFFKHIKFVVLPILQKGKHTVYVQVVEEWLDDKQNYNPAKAYLTANEKLDKILEFLAENPVRVNINPHTIHEEVFGKNITFQEAQELHQKLLVSGKVRVIGHRYIAHSVETDTFLQYGGFSRGSNTIANSLTQTKGISMISKPNPQEQGDVFISYSWDNEAHEQKVGAFTNHLRKNGFNAQIDKMISQQETATNFMKMMYKAMFGHSKVIVVLSAGYKLKADSFRGGVGEEFQLLINDINQNPRKYILVSFDGRPDEIIPFGLQGREIIDLSQEDSDMKLFRKLMDEPEFVFAPVSPKKPTIEPKQFGSFRAALGPTAPALSIVAPYVKWKHSSAFQGLYKSISYVLCPQFKNVSDKSVEGFSYEIKLRRELVPELNERPDEEGNLIIRGEYTKRVFPGQTIKGEEIQIEIGHQVLQNILGTVVTITIFSDDGTILSEFPIDDLFKVQPVNQPHLTAVPLTRGLFH